MYIDPETLNVQSTPASGLLSMTEEQEAVYTQYNGFVTISSTDPLEIEPDTEAWEAWKAAEAEKPPVLAQPTQEERLAALEAAMLSMMGVSADV